jgi:hypothetical protein
MLGSHFLKSYQQAIAQAQYQGSESVSVKMPCPEPEDSLFRGLLLLLEVRHKGATGDVRQLGSATA